MTCIIMVTKINKIHKHNCMSTRRNSTGEKQTQSSASKCHLCASDSPGNLYRKPATWTEESRQWVSRYVQNLPLDALVCDACTKFVKRNIGKADVVPRWLPKERKPSQSCMVSNCKQNALSTTSITTYSIASQYLELDECSRVDTTDKSLALCNAHYQKLYRELEFPAPCATCGVHTRYGKNHVRRCPDPAIITSYLQTITGFSGTLTTDSRVCKACYEFHSQILRHHHENPSLESVKSNLQVSISTFESCDKQAVTEEQYLDWLVQKVALTLARLLEKDEAVLLPELHTKFCHMLKSNASHFSISIVDNPPTTTWLLSSISIHFQSTLGVVCKHRKYGTLLYKRDGDLLKALSKALGNATGIAREAAAQLGLSAEKSDKNTDSEDDLEKACLALNKKVHSQAKLMIQTYNDDPLLCAEFDPNTVLSKLDPHLVKCMHILTAPVRGRHKLLDGEQDTTSVKKFFCLATILFTTNNQCYMPLHYILTYAIVCMGGSAELVRVLNRFGACVSLDTHNRISTRIVTMRILRDIQSQLIPHTLTVLSLDNIDLMQINAMVSALHSKRSWHGTSVQCVQPLPTSSILCDEEMISPPSSPIQVSSTNSPVVKHLDKRRRTLKEHTPSTVVVVPKETNITVNMHDYADYLRPKISQFTIDNFLVLQDEEEHLTQLRSALFQYFCLKEAKTSVQLPGLACCVSGFLYRNEDVEESNVAYVDIISLPADSKDTVLQILNKIYSKFVGELRHRWVIVVGDAKTYDILQYLKSEHGSQMEWMLPLPGDWHILYNYQKVLLKIYGDAGLLLLARVSNHRAETPTSLAQASHFKRTHRFILQYFETIMRTFIRLYLKNLESRPEMAEILSSFHLVVSDIATRLTKVKTLSAFEMLVHEMDETFLDKLSTFCELYTQFIEDVCQGQNTTRFWYDYITVNSMAYVALFVAIRNGDWLLRMAAIKLMAAVFHAFDRPIYQQIVPRHLADLLCFPPQVLHHLQKGAISVRLTKSNGRAVALDKAHEMKINRDAKFAVVRPSEELMERISNFMPFRAQCINNLKLHLGIQKEQASPVPQATSRDIVADQNITVMLDYIEENNILPTSSENLGLHNFLSHTPATPEQTHDLLNFRTIGQEEFQAHINYRILRDPSMGAPERRKRLHTFGSSKAIKKKEKQIDKEKKLHQTCMKKMMVMFARGESVPQGCGSQFTPLLVHAHVDYSMHNVTAVHMVYW